MQSNDTVDKKIVNLYILSKAQEKKLHLAFDNDTLLDRKGNLGPVVQESF